MKTRILSVLLLLQLSSYGQTKPINCKSILDKEPFFVTHSSGGTNDSFAMDMLILRDCGKLDSIDLELINGPVLGTILIQYPGKGGKITFRTILNSIEKFKKSPEYSKLREVIIISKTLENKPVNITEFEKDKKLLLEIGLTEPEIKDFKEFIQNNQSSRFTYKQAFTKYNEFKNQKVSENVNEQLNFTELIDLDDVFKKAKENNKNALIFFTCYACPGAIKMENNILADPGIKKLIQENYVYFSAHVDSKKLSEDQVTTIGQKYQKIQMDKFQSSTQPSFFVIDQTGKILSDFGYTSKTEDFMQFLKTGVK